MTSDTRTWLLLALTCACVEPTTASVPTPSAPAWAGVVVDHWLPGPHRRGHPSDDRSALEAECRSCHAEIAREWAGSEHAGSWSSAAFQTAFAAEPLPFCQACHAPEVAAKLEVPEWAAGIGVGCVTCHVEPGTERIWSARAGEGSNVAHPTSSSTAFAGPQACAGCHEFEFPDAAIREQPLLMQSTVREHAESAFPDRSCADCHMRSEDGHRSHAFLGAYDPATLARALIITARRDGDRVTVELAPGEVGHAVPTGDLLRRLEVRLEAVAADGSARTLDRRWLLRTFGPVRQHNGMTLRGQLDDTRVGPGGATVEFTVPESARAGALRWVVTHQRVAHWASEPSHARVEGQLEVAHGLLD